MATSRGGSVLQVAEWLEAEVGLGNVFTKDDLRSKFPGVQQIDRRLRDLRPMGWVIDTYREDASLGPSDLRYVTAGDSTRARSHALSSRDRTEALARASYRCETCGIAAGDTYVEEPWRKATLTVSRDQEHLRVRCSWCHSGDRASLEDMRMRFERRLQSVADNILPDLLFELEGSGLGRDYVRDMVSIARRIGVAEATAAVTRAISSRAARD